MLIKISFIEKVSLESSRINKKCILSEHQNCSSSPTNQRRPPDLPLATKIIICEIQRVATSDLRSQPRSKGLGFPKSAAGEGGFCMPHTPRTTAGWGFGVELAGTLCFLP